MLLTNLTSKSSGTLFPSSASDSVSIKQMSPELPRPSPSCLSHHVPPLASDSPVLGFSLVTQHGAVLEGGDRADSTHWPSCKSLFYGPCNDPPAGNLHSVALQIEPAASGSRRGERGGGSGWLQEVVGDWKTHIA